MKNVRILPQQMMEDLESVLRRYEGQTLPVYAEAEKIRQRWEQMNVALEDIVTRLVQGSPKHMVSIFFNVEDAKGALMGLPNLSAAHDNKELPSQT